MDRYICIHGHFYQPPRENPWLEAVERQDSARPFHDWNARITSECYAPNGSSRILDDKGQIARIVNNYASLSFNFGPTLLSWLQAKEPEAYLRILEADGLSRQRFSGHGSAMAQAYNHMILPLAGTRDRETQILWGIRDFERRFGRRPEGMWLPETAVDIESLDLMAAQGIRFTVLSPYQAKSVRPLGAKDWVDVASSGIDPTMAYLQNLPSGRSIALFFYDGPVARAVAFERLLNTGEAFATRLIGGFSNDRTWPQLMHIATDGESYGHHHRHGDMALAFALEYIERSKLARVTNYGEYLERHPPTHEVRILENTSWSCAHGVERWRANCGCNSGGNHGWNQEWRGPLRQALDWLRDELAPLYESRGRELFKDPWAARNDYIEVLHDRAPDRVDAFLERHSHGALDAAGRVLRLKLLEMQRHAMLMYTSCGWFFDDLSGIETVQVIQYAARAVQLAGQVFGDHLEENFLVRLEKARSNVDDHGSGRDIYEKWIAPTMLDLTRVAAHYAVSSLFEEHPDRTRVYCYELERDVNETGVSGNMRLSIGRAGVSSMVTRESAVVSYAALYLSDQSVLGGARPYQGSEPYQEVVQEVSAAFARADVPGVVRLIDKHFARSTFSLRSLFRDEQRRCIELILKDALEDADNRFKRIYERNAPIMLRLAEMGIPVPRALQVAAERSLNHQLLVACSEPVPDREMIERLMKEAGDRNVTLDSATLGYRLHRGLRRMAGQLADEPGDVDRLTALTSVVEMIRGLPFEVDIWNVQNIYYQMMKGLLAEYRQRAAQGDAAATHWVERFVALGGLLRVRVE